MSLIEDLRAAVDGIPPSHQPANVTDAITLLGSLIAYTEHGAEKFMAAVKNGNVADLYKDAEQLEADAQAPKTLEEAQAEIAALKQQIATQQAVQQQTTVGPVTSGEPAPAPEAAPAPAAAPETQAAV